MVTLYPEFYNDVFGPIMQPGSSSHMAGPCRVGYICNSLLGEDVANILIELDAEGSLAGTLGTMSEDIGMLNGALGRDVTHPDFFNIFDDLKKAGVPYEIRLCSMKESPHINSVKFILTGKSGKVVSMVGNSIGGGMMETVLINGYPYAGKGDTYVLCVFDDGDVLDAEDLGGKIAAATAVMESGIGCKEAGGKMLWFKIGAEPSEELKAILAGCEYGVMKPIVPVVTNADKKEQLFDTVVDWRRIAAEQGKSMVEVAIDYEMAASGWSREQVIDYMRNVVLKTMHRRVYAIASGEVVPNIGRFDLPTYQTVAEGVHAPLLSPLQHKALRYVFSARIQHPGILNVPGPMGNGGGFIAGILFALQEDFGLTDEDILRALFIAAGIGAICYTRTEPTGEVTGCVGECGVCTAMAAAAIVELFHGTPEQIEAAASMAIQTSIGWPCDKIPGGMGAPCTFRIMFIATMSLTFAQMSMLGEPAILPFHEAIDAAGANGKAMPPDNLATGRGGMCAAPTAQECKACLNNWRKEQGLA